MAKPKSSSKAGLKTRQVIGIGLGVVFLAGALGWTVYKRRENQRQFDTSMQRLRDSDGEMIKAAKAIGIDK